MKRLLLAFLSLLMLCSVVGCKKQSSPTASANSAGNYYNGGNVAQKEGSTNYFVGTTDGIYRVDTNSHAKTQISDQKSAKYLTLYQDFLYYLADYSIYRMKFDGTARELVVGKSVSRLQIAGDTLYYWITTGNAGGGSIYAKSLTSASTDTTPNSGQFVAECTFYFFVEGNYLYYINNGLYRSDLKENNKMEFLKDCSNIPDYPPGKFHVYEGAVYYAKQNDKGTYSLYAKSDTKEATLDIGCSGGVFNIYKDKIYFVRTILLETGKFDISLARCDLSGGNIEVLDRLSGAIVDSGFSGIFVANDNVYFTSRETYDVIYQFDIGKGVKTTGDLTTVTPRPKVTPDPVPAHVQQMYDRVKGILSTGEFPFTVGDRQLEGYTTDENGYSFTIEGAESISSRSFSFFGSSQGVKKTFWVYLFFNKAPESAKNLITLVLMATNPSLTKQEAAIIMNEMVLLFEEKGESKIIDNGEYLVFIETSDYRRLRAVHKDEIFPEIIGPQHYKAVDYNTALNGKTNKGTGCVMTGSVLSVAKTRDSIAGVQYTVAFQRKEDGKTYYLHYDFDDSPIILNKGERYKVYGYINDNSDTPDEAHLMIYRLEKE